eukprot:5383268-Prymnesium_polylepis.1
MPPSWCQRHPRHAKSDPRCQESAAPPAADDVVAPACTNASTWAAALQCVGETWCMATDGCIGSRWRPDTLGDMQRRNLLYGSRWEHPGSCFDPTPQHRCVDHIRARCPRSAAADVLAARQRLTPVYRGEFGFELLFALPFLHWLKACGLLNGTRACSGMAPFYFFSPSHAQEACVKRPPRAQWAAGSLPS